MLKSEKVDVFIPFFCTECKHTFAVNADDINNEPKDQIEIVCPYCGEEFSISKSDIAEMTTTNFAFKFKCGCHNESKTNTTEEKGS